MSLCPIQRVLDSINSSIDLEEENIRLSLIRINEIRFSIMLSNNIKNLNIKFLRKRITESKKEIERLKNQKIVISIT